MAEQYYEGLPEIVVNMCMRLVLEELWLLAHNEIRSEHPNS